MPIVIEIDVMLARRKRRSKDVAREIGISEVNFSLLKSGKVKGIRFETLARLCRVLDCDVSDLLRYVPDTEGAVQASVDA